MEKKSNKKIMTIVACCIIALVIILGIGICVYSYFATDESIVESFNNMINEDIASEMIKEETLTKDTHLYAVGETADYENLSLTLKNVSKKDDMVSDEKYNVYAYTFVLENTSDEEMKIIEPTIAVYKDYQNQIYFSEYQELYTDIVQDGTYQTTIKSGESVEFTSYLKIADNENKDYTIEVEIYDETIGSLFFGFDPHSEV